MSQTRPTPEPQQPGDAAANTPSDGHTALQPSAPEPQAVDPQTQQPGRPDSPTPAEAPMRGPDFTRPLAPNAQTPGDPGASAGGAASGGPYDPHGPQGPQGPQGPFGPGGPAGPQPPDSTGHGGMGGPPGPGGYGPPYAGDAPRGSARRFSKVAVVAVIAAGLIGGGAGAAGMYAITQGSEDSTQSQSGDSGSSEMQQNPSTSNGESAVQDGSTQAVAEKVLPSVVSISMVGPEGQGTGSGVVLREDGMILTNNHVAEAGEQGQLTVTFNNGETSKASVVGLDPVTDLAVIQAEDASDLNPIELGTSGDLQIGQEVVAIGSPLSQRLSGTVTQGIVSAMDRPVRTGENTQATVIDAIQTDAAINPGNSGGPLVDKNGNLIGINTAIATVPGSGGSGNIGLGFSIPIDQAKPIAEQLMEGEDAEHAQIGVQVQPDANMQSRTGRQTEGAEIAEVNPGTPAEEAGLRSGDTVTKVDDRQVADSDSLIAAVRSYRPGDKVELTYTRNGNEDTVTVTLGSDAEN